MVISKIQIVENILSANDRIAEENLEYLNARNILAVNIMASPGAGKTSVILQTIRLLSPDIRIAVIEGDTAPVTIDSDKVSHLGIPVTQINTGGNCHLDAMMVRKGLQHLELDHTDLVIIENIGNLICPASFKLGTHISLVIASVPEGDDKPYKYPGIYRGIDCLILNKIDLLPYIDFNQDYFRKGIKVLNPGIPIFPISCKTLEGFDAWTGWLHTKMPGK
ncbi:MAG: hydrogenase nickel incorporation protein HypB [Pelolinea sp.]|nr:hydrogenase nickel incorporation protein HypB [Pelolinea sp.]